MLECWNVGILEYWNIGMLEYWNVGILECWNIGILEYWNIGFFTTPIAWARSDNIFMYQVIAIPDKYKNIHSEKVILIQKVLIRI